MAADTIGALAKAGGVGVETVRYYQRRGLLRTPRKAGPGASGGVRRYDGDDLRRLRFIRAAQAAGFTLDEIAELMTLDVGQDRTRARELAQTRIAALDARIDQLQTARSALQALAARCGADDPGPCPIITAFDP